MIEKKTFGRTGHESTRTLFGAAAFFNTTQEVADETMELVMKYGINHIDTARSYGESEVLLKPFLQDHRDEVFLASKSGERTYDAAWREIHESFERMGVDQVDLWQMHFLVDEQEWETAMGPGGAVEAFIKAKEEGLTRYIGVTGHDWAVPKMHLKSLERYDFDTVLLPYSYTMMQNAQYAADFNKLMAVCKQRNVAVQAIKSMVRRPWAEGQEHFADTWYEPLQEQADVDRAVHWVLGNPDVFLNTPGDVKTLPKVLDAAARFEQRPSDAEMENMVAQREMTPLF
ncbi:MAG: aldo/keto reductase [Anaerolineales bacterium]|nr:aldo/keto reductase [Anaerolineales bacterium]